MQQRPTGPAPSAPRRPAPPLALWLLVTILLVLSLSDGVLGAAPPASVVAVANRDVEGLVVVDADQTRNFQPSASACRDQCANTTDCNIWVWCAAVSGCSSGGGSRNPSRFQQCWLKADKPPAPGGSGRGKFPRAKNLPDQTTGWMSGVMLAGFSDGASNPERTYSCTCSNDYTVGSFRFKGVCAVIRDDSGSAYCVVDSNCRNADSDGMSYCISNQPCTVLLDTDLQEEKVLASGDDGTTADSPEDCCNQCATLKGCNAWTWCSDPNGCGGERYRFRQCWLKQVADPQNPQAKKGFGSSPGWISGVRMAWLPV